jgi:isochorismate synthase
MTTAADDTGSRGLPARTASFLADALGGLQRDRTEVGVITVPAPRLPPEELLRDRDTGLFWTTPGAPVHAGVGAAVTLTASGPGRFQRVRAQADRLAERLVRAAHPGAPTPVPRLFGGFAFLPGSPSREWAAFGEATFVLPRVLYTRSGDQAWVSVAVTREDLAHRTVESVIDEVGAILAPTAAPRNGGAVGSAEARGQADEDADASDRWARSVASIQRRIEAGRAEKIVAARTRAVPLESDPDVPGVLRRLDREGETAARFAFRLSGDVFLGATPERLVNRAGRTVRTEALAGSVPADRPEEEERLRASIKEEAEHAYVVRAIADVLAPLCERLEYPSEPRIQRLLHVLHLQTPFVGTLADGVHVLELVERLHPTPAVGGLPTAEALAWIEREEPGSRGWYAAPVGWFDLDGDGEFGVALRSGLIHGNRAHLFAGAGIVRGSDPRAEFQETEVKLRTMLTALGVRR